MTKHLMFIVHCSMVISHLLQWAGQAWGILRHIGLPNTVASFRTWRGFQAPIAQPPGPAKTRAPTDELARAMDSARGQAGSQTETERVGFEPTVESPPHTLSKRAP